ncbi:hypothetical protein TGAM01_v206723 [Trichoderma gamsii]|uniref:Uncharacterized protein n=1 Tax=Trichoderma gamsii TaxID=398673 RepID=A0A0W7VKD8_9HYPO|nr:hypothetical protein TGAM01_v206723 [Trichoderma gamsii]PNP45167.1 hypothetical protein TGAMA5MH_03218 [Trichoderma gamsii]PON24391.1 hypothetical protein TGAM01_v206723 [Trichoderma gamsii]
MSTPRSGGSVSSRGSSSRYQETSRSSIQQLVDSLNTHRINTLTELCRIERIAAACDSEADARAFQQPMTSAWIHYVTSNQFLMELRGLTRNYPLSADIVAEAHRRVRSDPESNRSWNLAWLCLTRMRDDGLVRIFSDTEARKPEMWGGKVPSEKMVQQLATCFEDEWRTAIETMLRHWATQPTWY